MWRTSQYSMKASLYVDSSSKLIIWLECPHSSILMLQAGDACRRAGLVFIPMPVETLGGWHEHTVAQVRKLGSAGLYDRMNSKLAEAKSSLRMTASPFLYLSLFSFPFFLSLLNSGLSLPDYYWWRMEYLRNCSSYGRLPKKCLKLWSQSLNRR